MAYVMRKILILLFSFGIVQAYRMEDEEVAEIKNVRTFWTISQIIVVKKVNVSVIRPVCFQLGTSSSNETLT